METRFLSCASGENPAIANPIVAPAVAAEPVVSDEANHPGPEELQQLMCDLCGVGPWNNRKALRGHKIRKHGYRNAVQATTCPICHREFISKRAARGM